MNMKRKTGIVILLSLVLVGVLAGFIWGSRQNGVSQGPDSIRDGYYLLTVDGYGVTEEEFQLFLGDQKAITANYFWENYQLQPDTAFWTTTVNGETPIDYAKQRALDALVRSKVEFILANEYGILNYLNYDELLEGMDVENADRTKKAETGDVFYGLTQFTPFTYYHYLNNNIRSELESAMEKTVTPSTSDLRQIYEDNYEMFHLGILYEYEAIYSDGTSELIAQNTREVGKEDSTTEALLELFETMLVSDTIEDFDFHGRTAQIIMVSKTPQGYLPFEDAKDSLHVLYARNAASALINSRANAAKVEIDQARFDAIEMR